MKVKSDVKKMMADISSILSGFKEVPSKVGKIYVNEKQLKVRY